MLLMGPCELERTEEAVTLTGLMLDRGTILEAPFANNAVKCLKNCDEGELIPELSKTGPALKVDLNLIGVIKKLTLQFTLSQSIT